MSFRSYSSGWKKQAFVFEKSEGLRFGLVQQNGGPCGVLAAVQAHIIKVKKKQFFNSLL